jgi:GDP-L-fucose synthase
MDKDSKIYIAGHNGMVGSAIWRFLKNDGYKNIIGRTSSELDLRNQKAVDDFFSSHTFDYVFLAAAKVGGILANNTFKGDFIVDNIQIQTNVIKACHDYKVKKLLFLGSSCIYPKFSRQPIQESELLTGELESTNDAYAIAKISGVKMCQAFNAQYGDNFISVMPTNLYGINDNYHPQNSHVLPALIRKFDEAKNDGLDFVEIWGSGSPKREFLFADDLAEACVFLMKNYDSPEIINVGTGEDLAIQDLAMMVKSVVGYTGRIKNDLTKPDGTPRKLLDVNKLKSLGWSSRTSLSTGIALTYQNYLEKKK